MFRKQNRSGWSDDEVPKLVHWLGPWRCAACDAVAGCARVTRLHTCCDVVTRLGGCARGGCSAVARETRRSPIADESAPGGDEVFATAPGGRQPRSVIATRVDFPLSSVDERKLTKFYPSRPTVTDARVDNEEKTTRSRGSRMARTPVSSSTILSDPTRRVRLSVRASSADGVFNVRPIDRSFYACSECLLIVYH